MSRGYQALRESVAWVDLCARAKIFATGEDHVRFLHAMTTNQVEQLAPGRGCYAFFLNAQGHILADVHLLKMPDRILLDLEPESRERIYQHLEHYIIADDVTLEDATSRLASFAVEGSESGNVLRKLGIQLSEPSHAHVTWNGGIVARISFTGAPGFRIYAPMGEKGILVEKLESAGAVAADIEPARALRLEHAKPRYGEDIFDTTLPQETQQMHAVNYNKGCYIGQEIIERVRSRGSVHRLLMALEIAGVEPPPPQTKLFADGKEAGRITSAAYSPALGKVVALGYLRREFTGVVLDIEGREVKVRAPYHAE